MRPPTSEPPAASSACVRCQPSPAPPHTAHSGPASANEYLVEDADDHGGEEEGGDGEEDERVAERVQEEVGGPVLPDGPLHQHVEAPAFFRGDPLEPGAAEGEVGLGRTGKGWAPPMVPEAGEVDEGAEAEEGGEDDAVAPEKLEVPGELEIANGAVPEAPSSPWGSKRRGAGFTDGGR